MTTTCCSQVIWGLITGHAYTLLDVVDVDGGVTLAKIRNPWSSEKYVGPYSDKSSEWTDY